MGENQSIQDFVESYFRKLGAQVEIREDIMDVKNVPKEFERFIGKNSPYKIGFSSLAKTKDLSVELIDQDSYFLKAMRDYIKERGKTTLVKLDFSSELRDNLKFDINLANSVISKQRITEQYYSIKKFSFQISLQYLNQKDNIIKDLFIEDGQIKDFDLTLFNAVEGKKDDISLENIKEDYEVAKESIKEYTNELVEKAAVKLQKKLEKEIERIEKHAVSQVSEIKDKINKNNEKISSYKQDIEKSKTAKEKELIINKIEKLKEKNVQFDIELSSNKFSQEKKFQIKDEERKHSLDVSTKLINTTLVYYPVFDIHASLKSGNIRRDILLKFNPLKNKKENPACDVCKNELKNIYLCSSGHVVCGKCGNNCDLCKGIICEKCLVKNCDICDKNICKNCSCRCDNCWKYVCKKHVNHDNIHDKRYCTKCSVQCHTCSKYLIKSFIQKDSNGKDICKGCLAKKRVNSIFD